MITIPTISQLYTAILNDLETSYGTSIPLFGKNFLRGHALVQAGKLKLYYLAIGNLQKNIFVDTADPEAVGGTLERFGRIKLGRNPFPAQAGEYELEVTGTPGSTIPANTTWKSDDDSTNPGKLFILDSAYTLVASPDTITVRALEAGSESKMTVGETLTATIPIAGVNKGAEVTAETVEPLAAEELEDYRDKAIESYRTEPQGGAAADYRIWAADAQGVAKVYPYATTGQTAEVDLYIEATIADSTDGKGTPTAPIIAEVESVVELDPDTTKPINERGRRPLGVLQVNYLPVNVLDILIQITGFNGLTSSKETLIRNSLVELIGNIRPFVASADIVSERNDVLDSNNVIATILQAVPGAQFTSIQITVDSGIETSYQFTGGEIPFLDPTDVTFV